MRGNRTRKEFHEDRRTDARETAKYNRRFKVPERQRRDARMTAKLKAGGPRTPDVQSWLAAKLDKRYAKITDADIRQLLA